MLTRKRPLAGVDARMGLQVTLLFERPVAPLALKRTLFGVSALVDAEVARVTEGALADLALVRSEAPVPHVDVGVERVQRLEALAALWTDERLVGLVRAHVLLHTSLLAEGLLAHAALIRLLLGVPAHVQLHRVAVYGAVLAEGTVELVRLLVQPDRVVLEDVSQQLLVLVKGHRAQLAVPIGYVYGWRRR